RRSQTPPGVLDPPVPRRGPRPHGSGFAPGGAPGLRRAERPRPRSRRRRSVKKTKIGRGPEPISNGEGNLAQGTKCFEDMGLASRGPLPARRICEEEPRVDARMALDYQ